MAQLSIEDFGKALLKTGDLDPVYIALTGANLDARTLSQVCVAYWCFYHLGAASYIGSAKQPRTFWDRMWTAALNVDPPPPKPGERWPRAAERRHFRGAQAIAAVSQLRSRFKSADEVIDFLFNSDNVPKLTYERVAARAQELRGFGQWIAWKIADMGERVFGFPIDFSGANLGIYKDPKQGAALAYYLRCIRPDVNMFPGSSEPYAGQEWKYPITQGMLDDIVKYYCREFNKFRAPPGKGRGVNVQEVETIFCKYKSYYKSHYWVGKDIHEIKNGLHGWGDLADQLMTAMPVDVPRSPT